MFSIHLRDIDPLQKESVTTVMVNWAMVLKSEYRPQISEVIQEFCGWIAVKKWKWSKDVLNVLYCEKKMHINIWKL